MKKSDLIKIFKSQSEIARFFDISRAAVSKWPEDVPELWEFRMLKRRPMISKEIADLRKQEVSA